MITFYGLIRNITIYVFLAACFMACVTKRVVLTEPVEDANDQFITPEVSTSETADSTSVLPVADTITSKPIVVQLPDSAITQAIDTLKIDIPVDTISNDTIQAKQSESLLEAPVVYSAKDSVVLNMEDKKVLLYKGAIVTYQTVEIKADFIEFDMDKNEVYAKGLPDSTGVMQGNPVFKDGTEEMQSDTMRYNFKTQKGLTHTVKTKQGEGYVQGRISKMVNKNVFYIKDAKYTTCDADHPHFWLNMTRAKVISNDKTITGLAYVVLEDFPIYFPFLPFGFFPNTTTYSSGIIIPTYGEEANRGFFLREGGYYLAASPYFDLTMKGDIYSKGSWATNISSTYKLRYKFSGNFNMAYNVNKYGEKDLPDYYETKGFNIQWNHSQDAKANPFQTFSASVNLSTSSYDKENSLNINNYLSSTKSSSISYTKKWENTPLNMSVNLRHSQNSRDSTMSLSLPELTISLAKIYPFRAKQRSGKLKLWEEIGITYSANIRNSITAKENEILNKSFVKDWKNGWKHNIAISLPNFNLLKYVNVSPSVSYDERWYLNNIKQKYVYDYTSRTGTLVTDTTYGFKRNYEYSFGVGTSTTIYGRYVMINPNWRMKEIRHKMSPSLSFSYRPDFGNPRYGFWDSYIDENGKEIFYNRFANATMGAAGQGKSGAISFSLNNNVEAKMAAKSDTVDSKFEKISLLDNLSLSTSYNLVADSLNLSNIMINGRTTIKGVSISFGGTLDPYMVDSLGRKYNEYMWQNNRTIGRLTNANISFGLNFNSKKKGGEAANTKTGEEQPATATPTPPPPAGPFAMAEYADFNMPWNINLSYSFSYSRPNPYRSANITQSLNFTGSLSFTEKWNMRMTTNFDIQAREFSFTTFNISRTLHCFNMSFNFVPFGDRKSYAFTLSASSSMLRDLKIDKSRSWYDKY